MATNEHSTSHAVIDAVKMPKLKIDNTKIAAINAFATAFASFFGAMAIIAAIAGFTKGEWGFSIPFISPILGSNLGSVSTMLVTSLLALATAIIGLLTVRKITNLDAMKASWTIVSKFFAFISLIFVVNLVAILIYSLLSLGRNSSEIDQGELWGNTFVANLIIVAVSVALYFVSSKIAKGATNYLSVMRFVAIGVASVAVLMVVISSLVGFYAKKSSSYLDRYKDSLNELYDDLDY